MAFLIFLVVVLFLLAIVDLIVGVSNDAVNFLNSAIGSKVAPFRTIILVAAVGIILGSVFSSGIMEIARKGIFHPEFFTMETIMWVFLAVMLTDIILLDIFNSLGLPTSTTVSIIFELLGAAMITGLLISIDRNDPVNEMMKYINAESVTTIISGIFLSIIIAFTIGIVIQYLSRLLFTFNYEDKLKSFGALYAAIGITAIINFLLIKGLKGTTLLNETATSWISEHTLIILGILFVLSYLLSYLLQRFAGVNPLKMVVLMGTFSLAMAFAGNDLVNFIGVPITGWLAFENWQNSGVAPDQMYQDYLASNDVIVPTFMLLIAGFIMATTLWLSSKAKKVTETEVNLSTQHEGEERFKPNAISRSIVKSSILLGNFFSLIVPESISRKYKLSFEKSKIRQATIVHEKKAFDLVRASANLVIASILIAWATSMKLPLSTTYVSFMVAMGTSLADKAWGRESAVYRVAGVLSVIGGWFITALIAFLVAGLFAFILYKGELTGTIILVSIVALYIIFSHINFSKKEKIIQAKAKRLELLPESDKDIFETNKDMVTDSLNVINNQYSLVLEALKNEDLDMLEKSFDDLKELAEYGFKLRAQSIRQIKSLNTADKKAAELLLYSTDLLQDIATSALNLCEECLHYIKNLHRQPDKDFIQITEELKFKMNRFLVITTNALRNKNFTAFDHIKTARDDVRTYINLQLDSQVALIQDTKPGVKQAVLQTSILLQSRDILAVTFRILKMYRKYLK